MGARSTARRGRPDTVADPLYLREQLQLCHFVVLGPDIPQGDAHRLLAVVAAGEADEDALLVPLHGRLRVAGDAGEPREPQHARAFLTSIDMHANTFTLIHLPEPENLEAERRMLEQARTGGKARPGSKTKARVRVVEGGRARVRPDALATEEPLEIRLDVGGETRTVAVTMRTPGADFELAAGFLYAEGIISSREDVEKMSYCVSADVGVEQRYNIVNVRLRGGREYDLRPLERHFFTSSACGVCGKESLDQLEIKGCSVLPPGPEVAAQTVYSLPEKLREAQGLFEATGGLHAAALFDAEGNLVALREDVGRHNATDKLFGWALLEGRLPLSEHVVLVSGRSSYEILQKCLNAGVPVVCAISAPSSLAVDVARRFGMTLVGFLRGERFNVYAGFDRIFAGK